MVNEMSGSLLVVAPQGALIGIPVNTCGVAGKGMAKYMKLRWPDAYEFYVKECRRGRMRVGELKTYITEAFHLAFVPTKIHWSNPSTTDLITQSLHRLKDYLESSGIDECWLPALGCGKNTGQLDYARDLRPIVKQVFDESDKTIHLFKPMTV